MLDPDAVLPLELQPLGDGDDVGTRRFTDLEVGHDDLVAGDGRESHGYPLTLLCARLTHTKDGKCGIFVAHGISIAHAVTVATK
jgi:hypothetical protein